MPPRKNLTENLAAARNDLHRATRTLASRQPLSWERLDDGDALVVGGAIRSLNLDEDHRVMRVLDSAEFDIGVTRPASRVSNPGEAGVETATKAVEQAKEEARKHWSKQTTAWSSGIVVGLAILGVIYGATHDAPPGSPNPYTSIGWAAAITAAALLIVGFVFVGVTAGAVAGLVVGDDNRYSTSKVQVLLWTVLIVFAFVAFVDMKARGVTVSDTAGFASFDSDYLLLLGGPFAAAVLAKFTATVKSEEQTVQQSTATTPAAKDVVADHSGRASLTDVQFFLFNLVALGSFLVDFLKQPTVLPELGGTLVGLTGASALAYVGGKVVNSNPPLITGVTIASGGGEGKLIPGVTVVRVVGKNFMPSVEDKDLELAVLFGATEVYPAAATSSTDTSIQVTVPTGLAEGPVDVAVRTPDGATTAPWTGLQVQVR